MASLDDLVTVGNSVNKNISQLILAINTFASLYNSVIAVANGGTGNSSLTANSVLTGNGTNPIVAESLFVCTDAGNVGIGTTSPSNKLSVVSATNDGITVNNGTVNTIIYNSTGNISSIGTTTNHAATFWTNNTERMRVNAGAPILCLSGGSTTATGTGVAFPASQSASSDANTLDDYAENTWTVNFYDAATGGNVSATTATGSYTKIGRQVTATFVVVNLSTAGMTAGNTLYFSLPFTSANLSFVGNAFSDLCNFVNGLTQINSYVSNSIRGKFVTCGDAVGIQDILVSYVTSGTTDFYVTITYFT